MNEGVSCEAQDFKMQGAILQGSGNFDSMIRNVIMNVLLTATVIFIADNLLSWFRFTDSERENPVW